MGHAVTIELDIVKSVFQVHGIDSAGGVVMRRQVRRAQLLPFFAKQPKCLIGIEACASAHYWGRELSKLGHQVRLMPPSCERRAHPYGFSSLQRANFKRPSLTGGGAQKRKPRLTTGPCRMAFSPFSRPLIVFE